MLNKKAILPKLTDSIQKFLEQATGIINVQIVGGQKSMDINMNLKTIQKNDQDKWKFGQLIKDYLIKQFRKQKNYNLIDSLLNCFEGSGPFENKTDAMKGEFFHIVAIDSLTGKLIIDNRLNEDIFPKHFNEMNFDQVKKMIKNPLGFPMEEI